MDVRSGQPFRHLSGPRRVNLRRRSESNRRARSPRHTEQLKLSGPQPTPRATSRCPQDPRPEKGLLATLASCGSHFYSFSKDDPIELTPLQPFKFGTQSMGYLMTQAAQDQQTYIGFIVAGSKVLLLLVRRFPRARQPYRVHANRREGRGPPAPQPMTAEVRVPRPSRHPRVRLYGASHGLRQSDRGSYRHDHGVLLQYASREEPRR